MRVGVLILALLTTLPLAAAALTEAEMQSPEAQAVAQMLARQGLPSDVMRALTMDQVRYIKGLLEANDAASRAQALSILGF